MNGTRTDKPAHELQIGEYSKGADGWYGRAPNGLLCGLGHHSVTEHEDGTISVTPSILVKNGAGDPWHGYLIKGEWRSC